MNKLTATAGTLAALNESTGTGDVVLAWENTDGVTTFSSIPRTQLTQIITQHEAQRQAGQEQPTLCLSTVKRVASQLGWTPPGQAGQEPVAVVVIDYTGGHQRPTAEFVGGFLPDGTKLYAAPQPAAQLDKDAEIAQLQDLNDSADKALARQDAEIAALRQAGQMALEALDQQSATMSRYDLPGLQNHLSVAMAPAIKALRAVITWDAAMTQAVLPS